MFENRIDAHDQGDEVRAILEGVALQLRRQVDALCGGARPHTILSGGGGAKSDLWKSIKQQIVGIPLTTARNPESVARGAAMVAIRRLKNEAFADIARHSIPDQKA